MRARSTLLLVTLALPLAACSSEERTDRLEDRTSDIASVSTEQPARTEDATSPTETGRTPEPRGSHSQGTPPSGYRDVRADRERLIEDATAEDRPSAGSAPSPDNSVMKLVPG